MLSVMRRSGHGDRMLDIGREDTLDEKIATLQEENRAAEKTYGRCLPPQTEYDQQQRNELQEQKHRRTCWMRRRRQA